MPKLHPDIQDVRHLIQVAIADPAKHEDVVAAVPTVDVPIKPFKWYISGIKPFMKWLDSARVMVQSHGYHQTL